MKKLVFTLFIATVVFQVEAQTTIQGVVKDIQGAALPGVNILIKDSYDGTTTAQDGSFSFSTDDKGSHVIIASSVGFKSFEKEMTFTGEKIDLSIVLQEAADELDAVVISAGSFTAVEEKRRTILKAIDIATTAGATADIAGALNTLPGTQKVGESGRLFVRGGDSNEARTFIDGMVVLNAYGPSAQNTPSRGRFLPFMFKGTSFSTGGYSAEYGQALSSALVLNSKDKAEMNQTDIGILSVGADLAHTQVWDKSSLSAKLQITDLRPYMGLIGQRVDWKMPMVSTEGNVAYRLQIGKGIFKAYGNFSQTSFSLYNHDILDYSQKQQFYLNNNYRYSNFSYKTVLSDRWDLVSGLSYSYNQNAIKIDQSPYDETEKGIHYKSVLGHTISDKIELRFGAEVIDRHYTASHYNDTIKQVLSASFHEAITASFAEAEILATSRFVAKIGGRQEYNSLNSTSSVDPRLSLAFKPGKTGQFSFAYGTFRQSAKNQYLRVNNQLSSERAEHFILNYQIVTDTRTFRVEAYYKKYFDLVKFINGDPTALTNSGSGYAKGVELFWRDNGSVRNVDYWVSYSYLDTKRDYLNYPIQATPTFASKHNFSVVYKHFIPVIKTQLGITYSYSSPRTYHNPNLTSDQFQSQQTPSYQDLSTNISYLPKNWLIIYASCTNLLGRDNIFGYQYSSKPGADGQYASRALRQPASHFIFLAVFITISKNKSVNQLPNL